MRIDKFYKDSFILTLSNMTTSIIAFVFSIILSRKLGAEGLGLYGLIMPVYGLLLCFTSEGLITAISRISTVYLSRRDLRNLFKTLSTIFIFVILWASSVAFFVLICNRGIAAHIVRDERAAMALMMLSPAVLFIPLSAVVKGFFYGLGKYKITSLVDIFEKLFRVVILLSAISVFHPNRVDQTVAIAYLALAVGELNSMALLFICYRIQKDKLKNNHLNICNIKSSKIACSGPVAGLNREKSRIQLIFDIFVISVPIGLNGIISSVLNAISALVLPRRIVSAGFTYNEALALVGRFNGMALNISFLPYIIIGSMLTVLVPELSLHISRKDYWSAEERIAQVLKLAAAVGISTAIVCLLLPNTLGQLFYQRNDLGSMIRFTAPICLITFVSSPTFGILNALGKQNIYLRNSLIISVEGLLFIIIFAGIPAINIYGDGLSMIISSVTALIINMREIGKICEIKIGVQDVITLLLAGIVAYLVSGIAGRLMSGVPSAIKAALVVMISFGTVIGLSGFVKSKSISGQAL